MKKTFSVLAAAVVCMAAVSAQAATVSTSMTSSTPGPEAVAAGVPANSQVFKFYLTSDADVLSIGQVAVTGATLFQVDPPFGSNTEAPNPAFVALNRALEADSYITTPGTTSLLGPDLPGDGLTSTFGDLSNDGAQNNFQFATLTIGPQATGRFSGLVSVAGATGPEDFAFSFDLGVVIPEPASMAIAGLGLIGLVALRRRAA